MDNDLILSVYNRSQAEVLDFLHQLEPTVIPFGTAPPRKVYLSLEPEDLPQGRVVFVAHGWLDGRDWHYKSAEYFNPTWSDVIFCANRTILVSQDFHHTFLEGFTEYLSPEGVRYCKFEFGS